MRPTTVNFPNDLELERAGDLHCGEVVLSSTQIESERHLFLERSMGSKCSCLEGVETSCLEARVSFF
jgi:hypothetical protein